MALAFCALLGVAAFAAMDVAPRAAPFDEATRGGLRQGARVLTVTTLDDSGHGSLREALAQKGPRVVVFAVGGLITLKSDIDVVWPEISVLGQSAPDPGVTLTGGSVRIRTRDVAIEHLAIYSASSGDPKVDVARDSLSVIGLANRTATPNGVLLLNLSLGWAPDENLSIVGDRVSNVVVAHSLIAEGLARSAHPKPNHSAGILIGPGSKSVTLYRNLLVSNQFRNPQIARGTSVRIINNVIYNAERAFIYIDGDKSNAPLPASVDVVSNVIVPGSGTECRLYLVGFTKKRLPSFSGTRVTMRDNFVDDRTGGECHRALGGAQPSSVPGFETVEEAARSADPFPALPARSAEKAVMDHAGMRPARRIPVDRRIVSTVGARSAGPFDAPRDLAELSAPSTDPQAGSLNLPETIDGEDDLAAVASVRCARHLAVGGEPFGACSR